MSMSKALRFHILERDGFTCQYCGKTAKENELQIDHIIPKTMGGEDHRDNLIAACKDCNGGKGTHIISPPVDNDALRARLVRLKERRGLMAACLHEAATLIEHREAIAKRCAEHWARGRKEKCAPDEYAELVRVMLGLLVQTEPDELLASMDLALMREGGQGSHRDALNYLRGVLRNRRKERNAQER